jgi:hypothetical protein
LTSEDKLEGYSLFDHLLKIYPHHLEIWGLEKGSKYLCYLRKSVRLVEHKKKRKKVWILCEVFKNIEKLAFSQGVANGFGQLLC